ncbi:hypothetical protein EON65_12250 [archaeon]|nr:MAG: hypothetical protein EON65_12250 [archaeon]
MSSLFDHLTNWFYDCSSSSKKLRASSSVTKAQNVQVSLIDVQQVLTLIIQKCFEWQQNSKENTYAENAAAIMDEASSMTCQELMNPSGQQIILRYFSLLFIRGESKSFHFPLHRYLACNIIEASKHPHLTSTLYSIGLLLAEESKSTLSMVYSILHPILFAMEVRQGKWKRNGGCVYDQLMNYSESPFCRIFRDLDVVILQLVLIVIPIPLFLVFLFNEACVVKIVLQDGLDFVGTSCPIEPDFTAGMIVDCLHLLINIVTELPAPANANLFERCSQQIKREWIHKLAAESCTYSQLQDVLSSSSDFTKLPSSDLDKLLHDISVRNQVSALAVPTYSLKRELWSEYDPSFPHLNETGHQSATEKKPKATASQPMVRRCLPAHECFEDVRIKVLFEPLLLQSMHNLLHAAAWKFLRHGDYDRQRLLDVSFDCNDNVVHKIVHLLTLATHEAKALLEATCSNEEHSMVMAFFASLCQEGMLTVSWVGETVTKFDSSTFRTLFKLMKHYEEVGEATFMHNIGWLLNQCAALHSQCKILYDELQPPVVNEQNGQGNGAGVLDFDALKKQNAARVLQSMQAAASVFLASLEDISDSDEDNEEEDKMGGMTEVEGKGSVGDHVQVEAVMDVANSPANNTKTTAPVMDEEPEDEHLCIICQTELDQEDEEEGEPDYIGYLAFLQYSSLNHGDITNKHMHLVEPVAKAPHDQVLRGNWNACNARIGFCGHMMHRTCFTAYQASQHNTNADQNFMIVDTSQGQATCPLCKKLCNMLVPVVPKTKDQSMQVEEDNSVFSPVAWMRNFRIARQNAELSFPQLWCKSLFIFAKFPSTTIDFIPAFKLQILHCCRQQEPAATAAACCFESKSTRSCTNDNINLNPLFIL